MSHFRRFVFIVALAVVMSTAFGPSTASAQSWTLQPDDVLEVNDFLYSGNGEYALAVWPLWSSDLSGPNTFTSYHYTVTVPSTMLWSNETDGSSGGQGTHQDPWNWVGYDGHLRMQQDGNLVMYNAAETRAGWATSTHGNNGAYLNAQDDGNLVIYTSNNVPIWSR